MSTAVYVVKSGDTLGKIAAANHTSVSDLTQLNQIKNPNAISIGQKIQLPKPQPANPPESDANSSEQDGWGSLVLQFVDAINRPIKDLKVMIEALGKFIEATTDGNGAAPPVAAHKDQEIKVHVERVQGGTKHVATVKPNGTAQHARIISPKVAVKAPLRPHNGPPGPSSTRQPRPPGDEQSTRSPAGNPVREIAMECPNPQNLRLTANFKYREIVIAAAERANLTPQAMASIMNAEAATIAKRFILKPVIDFATGKPKLGKNGKPLIVRSIDPTWLAGEWDPRSASTESSARGMTQVLDLTWLDMACTNGTYLNARAKKEGWLTKTTVEITKARKSRKETLDAFKLANGTLVTRTAKHPLPRVLGSKPHLTGRATASDKNLQALLDLRFEPEYAIHTAADYCAINLSGIRAAGYRIDWINDGEKAKLAYLCHHLGLADAKAFINDTMSEPHAKYLLIRQIKAAPAEVEAKTHKGNYLAAHRNWLNKFVNEKIKLEQYLCQVNDQPEMRSLFAVCEEIRKKG